MEDLIVGVASARLVESLQDLTLSNWEIALLEDLQQQVLALKKIADYMDKDPKLSSLYQYAKTAEEKVERMREMAKRWTSISTTDEGYLSSALQLAVDIDKTVRSKINEHSRAGCRDLKLSDIPEELLRRMSGFVKGHGVCIASPTESHCGINLFVKDIANKKRVNDIKQMRLTCTLLERTSSHHFIDLVVVELNEKSLQRLEEISHHPTISKGVSVVLLALKYYDSVCARDLRLFAEKELRNFRRRKQGIESINNLIGMPPTVDNEGRDMRKVHEIVQAWTVWIRDFEDRRSNEHDISRLVTAAHLVYSKRFAAQEQLRTDGEFTRRVGESFGRMPLAKTLNIVEGRPPRMPLAWADIASHEKLFHMMTQPILWYESQGTADNARMGYPPFDVVLRLPLEIHKAGVWLKALRIRLAIPHDYSPMLATGPADMSNLTIALQGLEIIRLHTGYRTPFPVLQGNNREYLSNLLTALVSSSKLKNIFLEPGLFWDESPHTNPPSLLRPREWENLSHLEISGLPLSLAGLRRFMACVPGKLKVAVLFGIGLVEVHESWPEAIEILRQKTGPNTTFRYPLGAGLDDMKPADRKWVFENIVEGISHNRVEAYLCGHTDKNPLVELEELKERRRAEEETAAAAAASTTTAHTSVEQTDD